MHPHGTDRVRVAGDKVILFSRISKGWHPRVAATNIRTEHPGTAVLWDEQYYEVIEAGMMQGGGVRYVLTAWRDEHVFRDFQTYDDESEARIAADYTAAMKQRRYGKVVWLFSLVLGHLPEPIQNRLANEYGVSAARMTLVSTIPSVVLLGACAWWQAESRLNAQAPSVPQWLWLFTGFMMLDSVIRYYVFMSQSRGMGSLPGAIVYSILSLINPQRFPWPRERGAEVFMIAPEEDVKLRDAVDMRSPLFTLLSPAEQTRLAHRYGFEYRRHAYTPAIIILIGALLGVISSLPKVRGDGGITALLSLVIAGVLVIEQIVRLFALQHRPAGSILAPLVRPFVRSFL